MLVPGASVSHQAGQTNDGVLKQDCQKIYLFCHSCVSICYKHNTQKINRACTILWNRSTNQVQELDLKKYKNLRLEMLSHIDTVFFDKFFFSKNFFLFDNEHSVLATRFCGTAVQMPKVYYFQILFTKDQSIKHQKTLGTNKTCVQNEKLTCVPCPMFDTFS